MKRFQNNEPHTWACECGQINLLSDNECFSCKGSKEDCWEQRDEKKNRLYTPISDSFFDEP